MTSRWYSESQFYMVTYGDTYDPKYHPHPMLLTTCDSSRSSPKPSIGSLTCSSSSARCLKQGRRLRMFLQQAVRLPVLSVEAVSFPDFAKACPCVSQHISTVFGCQIISIRLFGQWTPRMDHIISHCSCTVFHWTWFKFFVLAWSCSWDTSLGFLHGRSNKWQTQIAGLLLPSNSPLGPTTRSMAEKNTRDVTTETLIT